jgi:seryl-tRNA synthetase
VHQFDKVEMFVYTRPEDAEAEHQLAWEEQMLAAIEVPYRVIDVAAGDLGSSAARKFDYEAWLPSQRAYRELTSASNSPRSRPAGWASSTATSVTQPGVPTLRPLSTARWPPPSGSSPSWRTTSSPTARCGFPRLFAPRWAASS